MAPIIEVSDQTLKTLNPKVYNRRLDLEKSSDDPGLNGFIKLPSGIYVAKERSHLGKNWFESHEALLEKGERMIVLPEFIEFLNYLRTNPSAENTQIYREITERKDPWRGEWIDADFKVRGGKLHVNSFHKLEKRKLVYKKSEVLDSDTLMKDMAPGISLEDFLDNSHTKQGLPTDSVIEGSFHYYFPRSDNNSVARFLSDGSWSFLGCDGGPSGRNSRLGVRAVKQHE